MEFRFKCCLRLFGRWESVKIQGTERTYKFYAYHMLDRLLTIGLILTIWIILYSFFMRSPRPNSIPVRFHMVGLIYWPKDVKIIIKPFLAWMALPSVLFGVGHTVEHRRQQRILRGELIARQGILRKIGYFQYTGRGGTSRTYRFVLEVSGTEGELNHEAYEMREQLFKEFKDKMDFRACRVELALLPPSNPNKLKDAWSISSRYINMLSTRVEKIFWLEQLSGRCPLIENLLFVPERNSSGSRKVSKK